MMSGDFVPVPTVLNYGSNASSAHPVATPSSTA